MWAVTHRAKPYQLAVLIKKSLLSRVPVKPLYNTIFKIIISPLSMLYLQKVLLMHLKKCAFYIIHKSKLPLRVSFKLI